MVIVSLGFILQFKMSLCYNTIPDEYVVEKTHERSMFNHSSTDISELNLFHKKPVVTPFNICQVEKHLKEWTVVTSGKNLDILCRPFDILLQLTFYLNFC